MNNPDDMLKQLRIDRSSKSKKKRRRWPWIVLALASIIVGLMVIGSMKPQPVDVAKARSAAQSGPMSLLDASGFVTPRRIATVSSKITGKVAQVLIEEGQSVAEGEVLAYLDATDARAQFDLITAQLASTRSQLAEARTQLNLAQRNLTRQKELAARKLVAQSALDAAQAERDAAAARLTSLSKAVDVSSEQVANAQIGIDNTVIRAPFAGVIVTKAAQPGEMISPISAGGGSIRTGIGTLVDMDSLEVQVDVNEAYIGRVQAKMPVEAVLNAYPDWKIPGTVIAIIPTADRTKATVRVRIALNSKDSKIVPDMGVRVSFLEQRAADAPPPKGAWVPDNAVIEGGDKSKAVFVVNDSTVTRTAVTVEESLNGESRLANLSGDETVVVSPGQLRDGARVAVKAADKGK